MKAKLRIGNSSGFWGDEPLAMRRQVLTGRLDYLTADYLAEVSMSILAKQQMRRPDQGYVADFLEHVRLSADVLQDNFPKIITNAGGNNPLACAVALQQLLVELGIQKQVMAVSGDNLMPMVPALSEKEEFTNLETGELFGEIADRLVAANAYTGSAGIVNALQLGADVVITGRASDSALTIGPLMYEMGWAYDDWDKLAAAMVAGHVMECGAQACGGNFTDWEKIDTWEKMGYPIVEMHEDGSFLVSKGEGTGGLVDQWTVKEQLVYEIADPKFYIGPDVVADLSQLQVADAGHDLVRVWGAKGRPAPASLKVAMVYKNGYKAIGQVVVGGLEAYRKAKLIDQIFWNRFPYPFDKMASNLIGANALGNALEDTGGNEILLQFVAHDRNKTKLERFGKEVAGLILAGPQGIAAHGGRPKIQEVYAYWPCLVARDKVRQQVWNIAGDGTATPLCEVAPDPPTGREAPSPGPPQITVGSSDLLGYFEGKVKVRMQALCLARSGDKGNSANIGVLARSNEVFEYLKTHLNEEVVRNWLGDLCKGKIIRYELPTLMAFNFVLEQALDGGGTVSSRIDPQGKMLAAAVLAQEVFVPLGVLDSVTASKAVNFPHHPL